MSEENQSKPTENITVIIAITALVLALVSGVVNYRQNNLAGLESSLRDTKDQLQLAKNDITDIKMKTIQQLVDAELAIKGRDSLLQENSRLREALDDANTRVGDLEAQVRRLDNRLTAGAASTSRAKTAAAKPETRGKVRPIEATAASVDLDIYNAQIAPELQQAVTQALAEKGFKGKYPAPSEKMSMADTTTVFYYDKSYKGLAESLLAVLTDVSKARVVLRKGSSPYPANKIIVHMIGQ
ncbi:MAG: hypothetical protein COW18_00410 [Zetaproteobacteria bacterium CG12_big_fil_rev_8_21_14_0_65_54_13]|nr:MAG: hypothetical protein COX55_09945 [Zetaproteobacteria bacterium CG23_combo_of_CG06-09_8_20_14_all_54_7]PIW51541.1 MAG: hypothetical protein COW18_00410 [Zetaproteobacteria bacterium CG12_big_fil_rev_8_21_14_0_65_54_13]PIX53619.1 MAG: hypothetical protein COZ50_12125 [Zetaproteobacteria bacterium CG_4_10_14_3_um_filter_54_28]PJA27923.1 MAG: hypothetical protein CO188_11235 [Zetaproteobacteria bacterium CG_4_9_14_3_um_filter_54_145]